MHIHTIFKLILMIKRHISFLFLCLTFSACTGEENLAIDQQDALITEFQTAVEQFRLNTTDCEQIQQLLETSKKLEDHPVFLELLKEQDLSKDSFFELGALVKAKNCS